MLVWAGNIIVDASTIIGGTRLIRIPILVGDLFFFDEENMFVVLYRNWYY